MSDPSTVQPHSPEPPAPEPSAPLLDPATAPATGLVDREADADAVSGLRIHRDPSLTANAASPDAGQADARRQIEWVRPTDLVARISARASERGVEWNVRAHEWARTQARATVSDARTKMTSLGRSMTARLTRNGPDPVEQEAARL